MKLWIDDDDFSGTRNPPSGWTWAKTSAQAIDILTSHKNEIDEISFDHDLGMTAVCKDCGTPAHHEKIRCCAYCYHDDTTRPVVIWLIENDAFPPVLRIHSANPVGAEWIRDMVSTYGPGITQ